MIAKPAPQTTNEKSVVALSVLLGKVIANPKDYVGDHQLVSALKRQSRLAEYSNPKNGISATSRSTVERLAEKLLDGGFSYFDNLRITALGEVEDEGLRSFKAKRRTKKRFAEDLEQAKSERIQSMVDLWHVTKAFHEALTAGRQVANLSRNPGVVERWEKEEERLLAMFDLAERPVVEVGSDTEAWLQRLRQL
ncbi:hypothetical protein [Pandoraea anhela]|uniref:Uncharacterized protein n=1 Tax=Pandoraea anhela TaxID=2508295 RepID=A0A5E4XH70_9BURK|nr:hypothetical protein [Pandoraea anhela]VVE35572.1 hypothetical protein PAN31108_03864 [Pandoraea anhela]